MQLASAGQIKLIVSEAIISELKRKLLEKMDWSESQTQLFIGTILELAELVEPDITLNVVPSDEDDNRIVECAIAGNAALIITFDKDLLRLKAYKMISIITPRQLTFYGLEE